MGVLYFVMFCVFSGLIGRALHLQVLEPDDVIKNADARSLRTVTNGMARGSITDRHGHVLALSLAVSDVSVDPELIYKKGYLSKYEERWKQLAELIDVPYSSLVKKINKRKDFKYASIKKRIPYDVAKIVRSLRIPGVYFHSGFVRMYPDGFSASHILGYTESNHEGATAIERRFNDKLVGVDRKYMVRKAANGDIVDSVKVLEEGQVPDVIKLSIDQKVQSTAYQALEKAVLENDATSGSLVAIEIETGEILAMANYPSYDLNDRQSWTTSGMRNRAIADSFEPGSTVKPLVIASSLQHGFSKLDRVIDTHPGWMMIGRYQVKDHRNYGELSLKEVLAKSSNIAVTNMALEMPLEKLLDTYYGFGIGQRTGIEIGGELSGVLNDKPRWAKIEVATLSYGYGLTATALQMANIYATLGRKGEKVQPTLLKRTEPIYSERVLPEEISEQVLELMSGVVEDGGTGTKAALEGYKVAGKTGTSKKSGVGGYSKKYMSMFAGVAPLENPRVAIAVVIDEPKGDQYYGGAVSGPVFKEVMESSMKSLGVVPVYEADEQKPLDTL